MKVTPKLPLNAFLVDDFCVGAPEDEIIDGEQLFSEMDLNNDGELAMSEMCECFKATLEIDGNSQNVDMMAAR